MKPGGAKAEQLNGAGFAEPKKKGLHEESHASP